MTVRITSCESLSDVPCSAWDALQGAGDSPFLQHRFLHGLEAQDCVGEAHGWLPRHLLAHDTAGRLVGAAPFYVKDHSYGELVFDWAWAEAYAQVGCEYYPKAVGTIPYTPVAGPRLLVHPGADPERVRRGLVSEAMALAHTEGWSGIHWLFVRPDEARLLRDMGCFLRMDLQYHWDNPGYGSWDEFLATLTARRRKEIRRERRRVREQGLHIRIVHGDTASADDLEAAYALYAALFQRKYGYPTLTRGFFHELGPQLGSRLVLFFAEAQDGPVAVAICMRDEHTLYGRHWGTYTDHHCLHFELCYYRGIEYCIEHDLARFEPGAQGEHKIARGFLPVPTWSAHWIRDPEFRRALERWSRHERAAVQARYRTLMGGSPYRTPDTP